MLDILLNSSTKNHIIYRCYNWNQIHITIRDSILYQKFMTRFMDIKNTSLSLSLSLLFFFLQTIIY